MAYANLEQTKTLPLQKYFHLRLFFVSKYFLISPNAAADRQHFRLLLILRLNSCVDLNGNCGTTCETERKICVKMRRWCKSQRVARKVAELTKTFFGLGLDEFYFFILIKNT